MLIRPMKSEDLQEVISLSQQLGYPIDMENLQKNFQTLDQHAQHALFVAITNKVVGWVHLEKVLDLIEMEKIEIKAFIVAENERSKGIGNKLLNESKHWARKNGVSTIYLSCNILRERAHLFYIREGFTKMKTSHFFEVKI